MILIQLGYEREGLQRSEAGDVPHGWLRNRNVALCGAQLRTSFESILFATPGGYEFGGTVPYDTRAHTEAFGQPKCVECLEIAAGFDSGAVAVTQKGKTQ